MPPPSGGANPVSAAQAWTAQKPIRIGASISQTGALSVVGQINLRGYQLCVKHLNDKGGVLERQLELVVYDDGSDSATAIRLYQKLITQDKVDLVLGPFGALITDPVADVTEKHKMPMVAANANATSIYRYLQEGAEVHLRYAFACGGLPGRAHRPGRQEGAQDRGPDQCG